MVGLDNDANADDGIDDCKMTMNGIDDNDDIDVDDNDDIDDILVMAMILSW